MATGRYNNNSYSRKSFLDSENKRRYFNTLLDPTIPKQFDDIYVMTTIGDRVDLLAYQYYNNAELWFIIAAANPDLRKDSLFIEPGTQLRIPRDYQQVLSLFQEENSFE